MKIERNITYYNKLNEELVGEYNVDHIDFDFLISLIKPSKDDPLLYNVYSIDNDLAFKLKEKLKIDFDFNKFDFFLECYQV